MIVPTRLVETGLLRCHGALERPAAAAEKFTLPF
jgi:hypothetical protein